jgi:glucose/arabinose dehydrogenase
VRTRRFAGLAGLFCALGLAIVSAPAGALTLPSGFQDSAPLTGLTEPTTFRFAADGRVFVAEKAGRIVVFDNLEDPTPTEFANLSKQVYDQSDRGLLGLALDPEFPAQPFVYALYTFDHVIGEEPPGQFPRWGEPESGYVGDPCPRPPGSGVDACPVSGRLVRLVADGNRAFEDGGEVVEDVLIEDWCQQGSSHSIGDLEFGPEGALFASGGEGAIFGDADYGQLGWPQKNMCADPPGTLGEALELPDAEGGSLRSQDLLTPATPGDPTGLSGTVIRIDPETGAGLPGNPLAASADPNERRIIASGLRNPFRFTIDEETNEVYAGNVGGGPYEEIDRFSTAPSSPHNGGWPCFEADGPFPPFESLELDLCESLYAVPGSTSEPFFFYYRWDGVTPEDDCPPDEGSAIAGSSLYRGGSFPPSYEGAFFFADSVLSCIYVMFPGPDGRPDPSTVAPFLTDGGLYPGVDIQVGPGGDLYYSSMFGPGFSPGAIHRVSYFSGNKPPVAALTATPEWAPGTLVSTLDASGSSDADGEDLSYEWDLDLDGDYATGTATRTETFTGSGNHTVAVRVSDEEGATSVARVTLFPGATPPVPEIVTPVESEPGVAGLTWAVDDEIAFEGAAEDAEDGELAATSLDWSSRLYHCSGPGDCHAHSAPAFPGVASGSLIAPNHEYPSRIELTLTATDDRGLTASRTIAIYPRPADLTLVSEPPGLKLTAGLTSGTAPFSLTAIEGAKLTLSAPATAKMGGGTYDWQGWSDGGARVHPVLAGGPVDEYTAVYALRPGPPVDPGPVGPGPDGGAPPPQTRLGKHPAKRTGKHRARFLFSADQAGARLRCRLDGASWGFCRSPRVYPNLAAGRHSFEVVAVGADGQYDPTPIAFRWKVLR